MERRTKRVRIAVAIDSDGEWNAVGWGGASGSDYASSEYAARDPMDDAAVLHWIEADVPIPPPPVVVEPETIAGTVDGVGG